MYRTQQMLLELHYETLNHISVKTNLKRDLLHCKRTTNWPLYYCSAS